MKRHNERMKEFRLAHPPLETRTREEVKLDRRFLLIPLPPVELKTFQEN